MTSNNVIINVALAVVSVVVVVREVIGEVP